MTDEELIARLRDACRGGFKAAQQMVDAIAALPAVREGVALSVPEVGSVIRALDSVISEMYQLRAALRGHAQ